MPTSITRTTTELKLQASPYELLLIDARAVLAGVSYLQLKNFCLFQQAPFVGAKLMPQCELCTLPLCARPFGDQSCSTSRYQYLHPLKIILLAKYSYTISM